MYLCKEQEPKHNFKLEDNLVYEKDLVSVIIPVYARKASSLPECLENVYAQDYAKIELVIVNNGINKRELESLLSSFKNENLRITHIKNNMGASYGRNEGVLHSRGEFLWFVDSDVYRINPKAVSFSAQLLKGRDDIGAIGTQCSEVDDTVYLFLGRWYDKNFKENKEKYKLFEDEYINTCNLLMRKKDFMEIGGFTDFIEYIQDDLDLGFKIRKLGLKCIVDYRTVAYHPFPHKGWDKFQLWMFYKNSILFYSINYSFVEILKFLIKKCLSKTETDKDNRNETENISFTVHRLNNLSAFFSASLFLAARIFSVIKQRHRRQKLLSRLAKKSKIQKC